MDVSAATDAEFATRLSGIFDHGVGVPLGRQVGFLGVPIAGGLGNARPAGLFAMAAYTGERFPAAARAKIVAASIRIFM